MASSSSTKRKRVTVTIEQKLDILKKLDQVSTMSSIASEFGVGKSTVFDIKNSREKIINFVGEAQDDSSLKSRCIVRRADDDAHDRVIHHWFIQERHKGMPISGVLVMEKARLLYQQLYPGKSDDDFKASSGWLHRFKKKARHKATKYAR